MDEPDPFEIKIMASRELWLYGNTSVTEGWLDEDGNEYFIQYEIDSAGNVVPPSTAL